MQLTLEHIGFTYQPDSPFMATAITDVDWTVNEGEFWAVIGHTGSGKSTLLQHLNGLIKPTEGRVLFDGRDIHGKDFDKRQLRQKVGLVFQYPEHQLFDETVKKDIAFGPRNLVLDDAETEKRVLTAMRLTGLDPDETGEKSPFELSGGQMRRVALAGVLAMQPEILVLDEPIAGLDPAGRNDMMQCIKNLHKNGTTIIMVTHSMDDAAAYADHIAVMDHGRMCMQGSPQEVFSHADELKEMGLDVPQSVALYHALREAGLAPDTVFINKEEAVAGLYELLTAGKEQPHVQ